MHRKQFLAWQEKCLDVLKFPSKNDGESFNFSHHKRVLRIIFRFVYIEQIFSLHGKKFRRENFFNERRWGCRTDTCGWKNIFPFNKLEIDGWKRWLKICENILHEAFFHVSVFGFDILLFKFHFLILSKTSLSYRRTDSLGGKISSENLKMQLCSLTVVTFYLFNKISRLSLYTHHNFSWMKERKTLMTYYI